MHVTIILITTATVAMFSGLLQNQQNSIQFVLSLIKKSIRNVGTFVGETNWPSNLTILHRKWKVGPHRTNVVSSRISGRRECNARDFLLIFPFFIPPGRRNESSVAVLNCFSLFFINGPASFCE